MRKISIIANYPDSFTRKISLAVVSFGILFWITIAISYINPNLLTEILEMAIWLGLCCGLGIIVIFGMMSYGPKLWLKPTLVCLTFILSILLVAPLTNALDDWWLKNHIGEFNQFVSDIKNGTI